MKLLFFLFSCFLTLIAFPQQSTDQRIAILTLEIKNHPDNLQNYISRGKVYMDKYEPKNALPDFSKAIEIDKNNIEALKLRANAYYFLEKYDSSLVDIQRVLKEKPGDADVWNRRGLNHYWSTVRPNLRAT